ncbi:alpha-ketoglutarate-dependent dioxygenase AlkB [Sphingomonas morindae]|uniref:Alpha-ketoglutarate-dependent dioxygenase AlkB n=1 Tax=Sphingomonas morindae TaxID=1541170 RepID=A0ABY4X7B4_9SPHN|nr:alpha-ketoglutarate-dependent dioxygenase AlkB [Sphingomonas morindae]USI72515.1 alpha-ketoglutarate-dependent dioxygenase AlkB [Sphingomonas morindae]
MSAGLPLFDVPPLPGLAERADLIDAAEEAALIAAIDASGLTPFRFQQWEGLRLTRSLGWHYDFARGTVAEAAPLPEWLLPVRARAAALAGLPAAALEQALVIRYDPGAGIGWHRDRPVFDRVVGVSLGAAAAMRFRRRTERGFERVTVPLPPRGGYALSGEARGLWEHSIAPLAAPRWSITFRSLAGGR